MWVPKGFTKALSTKRYHLFSLGTLHYFRGSKRGLAMPASWKEWAILIMYAIVSLILLPFVIKIITVIIKGIWRVFA